MGRFQDLSAEEVGDLFLSVHRVAPVIKREFGGTSLTISVQVYILLLGAPHSPDNDYCS